jgi:hypothetical protein
VASTAQLHEGEPAQLDLAWLFDWLFAWDFDWLFAIKCGGSRAIPLVVGNHSGSSLPTFLADSPM